MGNPFTAYPVTSSWADHIARGSLGGIDYGMSVGTPLPASRAGWIRNIPFNGTGGHTVVVTSPGGWSTVYMHLSSFTPARGVQVGDIIGYSGGAIGTPGAGGSTGPHLHAHDITPTGVRVPPFQTTIEPFIETEDEMLYYRDLQTNVIYGRDLTRTTGPQLVIIGKNPSGSVAFTIGKLDLRTVLDVTGAQMAVLVTLYGVAPSSAAEYALWKGNVPPVKGLNQ